MSCHRTSLLPTVLADLAAERGLHHLDQYVGLLAMEPGALAETVARVGTAELIRAHVGRVEEQIRAAAGEPDARGRPAYALDARGIATVEIVGAITKYGSSLGEPNGTLALRRIVRAAAADPKARAIMLLIDSPGGSVMGVADLAETIAEAAKAKPTTAYVQDVGASAAYWLASQAGRIAINSTAMVGSIGVYSVVADWSGWYAKEGVKVHVIRSGKFKGAGAGDEITDEQLSDFQRQVDDLHALFVESIAAGRGIGREQADELADGRVHIGAKAVGLGLADAVETIEAAADELIERANSHENRALPTAAAQNRQTGPKEAKEIDMSKAQKAQRATDEEEKKDNAEQEGQEDEEKEDDEEQEGGGQAASYTQIKAACPGADAEFIGGQCEKGATVVQAQRAWMVEQNHRIAAANARAKRPGVQPVGERANGSDSAAGGVGERFEAAVAEKVRAGMKRHQAVQAVCREDSELRAAYVAAYNSDHGRRV